MLKSRILDLQSNLYKTKSGHSKVVTQKWSSWKGGRIVKHFSKTTTNKIWSFLAGF